MKQETLEEAANRMYEPNLNCQGEDSEYYERAAFVNGAKWQAERMYSEEDLRKAIQLARLCTMDGDTGEFIDLSGLTEVCTYGLEETHSEDSIIEQFKKK